jgi:hypothetical protein
MGILIGLAIGIPLGIILLIIRHWLNCRCLPSGERREYLLCEVKKMKKQGMDYKKRLTYLRQQGLTKDVADFLLGEAERLADNNDR